MDIRGLVIYRNLKHQTLFEQMAGLMGMSEEKESTDSFACAGQLIELAAKYGFEGNLCTVFWRSAWQIMKMHIQLPVRSKGLQAVLWIFWRKKTLPFSRHCLI